jgi:ubiquinone/menaquinone biosynthesis C-methylase UbiE
MNAFEFLRGHFLEEARGLFFGDAVDLVFVDYVCRAWMNDETNSRHRYAVIERHLPKAHKILDMASGCGTFVYYGLLNGYETVGIDPEVWKKEFVKMKAKEYGYPEDWTDRFYLGVGEDLPFEDDAFDCVSSYQTLEHVQNPKKCLSEMLRVTKVGGGIHIMCPDYRSTYEGHYLLPWLPLMPKRVAEAYLRVLNRPTSGLGFIKYVTLPKIKRYVEEVVDSSGKQAVLVDLNARNFQESLQRIRIPYFHGLYRIYWCLNYFRRLFRKEIGVNLLIYVVG